MRKEWAKHDISQMNLFQCGQPRFGRPAIIGEHIYDRVNEILKGEGFDEFAERECVRFYKSDRATEHRTGSVFSDAAAVRD